MNEGTLKSKSFAFAVSIVKLYKILGDEKKEYIMSKQLMRSGTAVGALYREAEHAESKADFIHKLAIAQKEANESIYWIDLLHTCEYLDKRIYESISEECKVLLRIITAIIKTTKSRM